MLAAYLAERHSTLHCLYVQSVCAKLYVAYNLIPAKWDSIQYNLLNRLIGPEQHLQPIAIAPLTIIFAVEV